MKKLSFILMSLVFLAFVACDNAGESKDTDSEKKNDLLRADLETMRNKIA